MHYALVDGNGIVQNLIDYDPSLPHGPYTPPEGLTIQQINDWCQIGQPMTMAEPPLPTPTAAQISAGATLLLRQTDIVASRCYKAGVAFPTEWQTYVAALRAIVASGVGPYPTAPAYPAGT